MKKTAAVVLYALFFTFCALQAAEDKFALRGHQLDPLCGPIGMPADWTDLTEKPAWSFTPAAEATQRGYLLFSRHYMEDSTPNSLPAAHELLSELKAFAAPGEYEPLTFLLRTFGKISDFQVSVSELRSAQGDSIDAGLLELRYALPLPFKSRRHNQGYEYRHEILVRDIPPALPAESSHLFWLTVYIPEHCPPGSYAGEISISANGMSQRLPVLVRVLPVVLQEDPTKERAIFIGGHQAQYEIRRKFFLDMREHGMNTVAPCNFSVELNWQNSDIQVGFQRLDREVKLYREAGFTQPLTVDMRPVQAWVIGLQNEMNECQKQGREFPAEQQVRIGSFDVSPNQSEFEETAYRRIVREIVRHAQENNYPKLYFLPQEEATNKGVRIQQLQHFSRILKEEGVTVSAWSNGTWGGGDDLQKIDPWLDVRYYNYVDPKVRERTKKAGDFFGIYNHGTRLMYGFFAWRVQAEGMMQWAYTWAQTRDMLSKGQGSYGSGMVYPGKEGPLPSPRWERLREGYDDSRYLYTLEQLLQQKRQIGDPAVQAKVKAAEAELQAIRELLPEVTTKMTELERSTDPSQFDIWRFKLARQIMQLQDPSAPGGGRTPSPGRQAAGSLLAGNHPVGATTTSATATAKATPTLVVPFTDTAVKLQELLNGNWPAEPASIAKLRLIGDQARSRLRAVAADADSLAAADVPPNQPTAVQLLYNKEALFLSFVCSEDQMQKMVSNCRRRDEAVYSDDAVEIFLKPDPNGIDYYQIAVNSIGAFADKQWQQSGLSRRKSVCDWNPDIEVQAKIRDKSWCVAVKIPFAGFGLNGPPVAGSFWYLNLGREQQPTPGVELSTWAPVETSFHEIFRWGKLFFAAIPAVLFEDLRLPPARIGVSQLEMPLQNNSGKALQGWLQIRTSENVDCEELLEWSCPEAKSTIVVPYRVQAPGAMKMQFTLLDQEKKSLYSAAIEQEIPPLLEIQLRQNDINTPTLRVPLRLNIQPSDLSRFQLLFQLQGPQTQLEQKTAPQISGQQEFLLNLEGCPPGDYQLRIILQDQQGTVLQQEQLPFHRLENIFQ